jgi:hypothetical protein
MGQSAVTIALPAPIAAYIAAENDGDPDAVAVCFASNAVVRDEGRTIEGLAGIKAWKARTTTSYHHTIEPLKAVEKDGMVVLTNRLTGNFPGSPVELQFIFGLAGAKIASLEIRP